MKRRPYTFQPQLWIRNYSQTRDVVIVSADLSYLFTFWFQHLLNWGAAKGSHAVPDISLQLTGSRTPWQHGTGLPSPPPASSAFSGAWNYSHLSSALNWSPRLLTFHLPCQWKKWKVRSTSDTLLENLCFSKGRWCQSSGYSGDAKGTAEVDKDCHRIQQGTEVHTAWNQCLMKERGCTASHLHSVLVWRIKNTSIIDVSSLRKT